MIIILSFFSAVLGLMSVVTLFFGPLPFLSFPFYAEWGERRINLPQPFRFSDRIDSYEIRFIAAPVFQLVPQGPVVQDFGDGMGMVQVVSYRIVLLDTEIGAIRPEFILITLFLFFVIVNAVGALLGFSMSKIRIIDKTEWGSIGLGFWWRVALGIVVLVFGIWLFTVGEVVQTSPSSKYYYSYNAYPYLYDAFAFVIFGISWLILMIAENSLESNKNAWTFPSES